MSISSLFTAVKDAAVSSYQHVKAVVSTVFSDDVVPAITTFLHVIETNGGAALIQLALSTVIAAESGTPFGVLTSTLIASAETQGIQVAEIAAKSALQVAQTHLQADLAAKTEAPAPAAGAATGSSGSVA